MIVDFHCHILPPVFEGRHAELSKRDATHAALFPDSAGRIADAESLLRDMDRAGVDHAVVMGFGWTDHGIAQTANDYLLSASKAHPDRISAFASVNPAWGDAAVVGSTALRGRRSRRHRGTARGHAGVRHLRPGGHGTHHGVAAGAFRPDHRACLRTGGARLSRQGANHARKTVAVRVHFPDNRIVLAHLGGGLPFYAAMPEVGRCDDRTFGMIRRRCPTFMTRRPSRRASQPPARTRSSLGPTTLCWDTGGSWNTCARPDWIPMISAPSLGDNAASLLFGLNDA